jgi:hypothetical protein
MVAWLEKRKKRLDKEKEERERRRSERQSGRGNQSRRSLRKRASSRPEEGTNADEQKDNDGRRQEAAS